MSKNLLLGGIKIKKFIRGIISKFIYDLKISHKLIVLILCMILTPTLVLLAISFFKTEDIIKNEISGSYQSVANQCIDNINYKLGIHQNLLDNIVMNRSIQKILLNPHDITSEDTISISKEVSGEIDSLIYGKNVEELYAIKIYGNSYGFLGDGKYISNLNTVKDEEWYKDMEKQGGNRYVFTYTTSGLKKKILSIVKPLVNINGKTFSDKLGVVRVDIDVEQLLDMPSVFYKGKCQYISVTDNNKKVLTDGGEIKSEALRMLLVNFDGDSDNMSRIFKIDGNKKILVSKTLNTMGLGWNIKFLYPYEEIQKKIFDTEITTFIAVTVLLAVFIGLTVQFSLFFSKRIYTLVGKMLKVKNGDLKITENVRGKDEIGMLDINFNQMVEQLSELIKQNYIQKLEKREAELYALQAQINPHFLYNTLETINSISSLYGCEEVSTISRNLGRMFRYSISAEKSDVVRLKDELQHIQNYISIQQVRFENKFEISYHIANDLLECRMIKFVLQPIVENAFIHGFKGKEGICELRFEAFVEKSCLIFSILDNGKGMDKEQLSAINVSFQQGNEVDIGKRKSIGVRNVNSRIKLAYGEQYGLSLESTVDVGTKVILVIPYII